jgi:hypothetical protein
VIMVSTMTTFNASFLCQVTDRYPEGLSYTSNGVPRSLITVPFSEHVVIKIFIDFISDCICRYEPRVRLVNGIIDRAERYHVILIRGTPTCGKATIMKLVANELLARYSEDIPLHIITGWDKKEVTKTGNWNRYLLQVTGIKGDSWLTSCAYLLLDEAQESYWDSKDIHPDYPGALRVILFASYGPPDRGNAGFNPEKYRKTPMVFAPGALISMRVEEFYDELTGCDNQNRLGLLLNDEEATDVMNRYISAVGPLPLSKDLMDEFFLISSGHVGSLRALMGVLERASVSILRSLQFRNNICLETGIC